MKSLPSKTQHPKKSRDPETLRASSPFLILALTSVPSISLPQLHTLKLLQKILMCLLPVFLVLGVKLVQIPSSPVASHSSSVVSAVSWLCSHGQDSGNATLCSSSLSSFIAAPVLPAGAFPVCGRGHRGADGAAL